MEYCMMNEQYKSQSMSTTLHVMGYIDVYVLFVICAFQLINILQETVEIYKILPSKSNGI